MWLAYFSRVAWSTSGGPRDTNSAPQPTGHVNCPEREISNLDSTTSRLGWPTPLAAFSRCPYQKQLSMSLFALRVFELGRSLWMCMSRTWYMLSSSVWCTPESTSVTMRNSFEDCNSLPYPCSLTIASNSFVWCSMHSPSPPSPNSSMARPLFSSRSGVSSVGTHPPPSELAPSPQPRSFASSNRAHISVSGCSSLASGGPSSPCHAIAIARISNANRANFGCLVQLSASSSKTISSSS
mmetsp:Transcript_12726/g.53864  ORF Transcript_12726/g.53864 Transcript_12726/m.53864 type:complete len:239 (-) Transcript_12726:758-1474(-)